MGLLSNTCYSDHLLKVYCSAAACSTLRMVGSQLLYVLELEKTKNNLQSRVLQLHKPLSE